MHAYAIWSDEHKIVLFGMAIISVALASVLHLVAAIIPFELAAPSAFAIYGTLFLGFDRLFWRWKFLRRIGLVRTPDFNGEWEGKFQSSLTLGTELAGKLEVSQTWTKICLFFTGTDNRCHSQVAAIYSYNPNRWNFSWQYQSTVIDRSIAEHSGTDRIHHGTSMVVATNKGADFPNQMDGHYYTDEKRKSYGKVSFIKKVTDGDN